MESRSLNTKQLPGERSNIAEVRVGQKGSENQKIKSETSNKCTVIPPLKVDS